MARILTLTLALVVASASGTALSVDNRPVSKVTTLLKDMISQLQKEGEEDKEVYEAYSCWCETGKKSKTLAISGAESHITFLNEAIADFSAQGARLNAEIEKLNKEIAANEEAMQSATSMRKKELSEFGAEEGSMLSSISAMAGAVDKLSAHNGAAFLQQKPSVREGTLLEVVATIRSQLRHLPHALQKPDHDLVESFLQDPEDVLNAVQPKSALLQQGAAHNPGYAPQSGQIFGVLKGMKESFETNLAASQKEESKNQADYEALKAAKTAEIAAGNSAVDAKTSELAQTDSREAEANQDLKDTQHQLSADQSYLANLKEQCANIGSEFAERTKTRQMEISAVSKALAFLTSDDAKDLFSRTFGSAAAFLQVSQRDTRRAAGAGVIRSAALRSKDPRLSTLATRVLSPQDALDQVKVSIRDMVEKLEVEKEEEIKHKDFCVDSIQKNERDTDNKNRDKADAVAVINSLTTQIDTLAKELSELKAEIGEMHVAIKRAGEEREKENREFQMTVADQRATAKLVAGALEILKSFYEKAALTQTHARAASVQPAGPPPPSGFKKTSKKSGGVVAMMEQIIEDAKSMVQQALKGEEDSQLAYESYMEETNASIKECQKSITNKSENKAQAESDRAQKKVDMETIETELSELSSANRDLHKSCDYTLHNFDQRQAARDDEIMSLKQAIQIVSGASGFALPQTSQH